MPKVKIEEEEESTKKEEARDNFDDFLDSFKGVEEAIREHTGNMKDIGILISEDLIPAVDELTKEVITLRVITAQSQGRKSKPSILEKAAQEIFGGGD